MYGEEALIRAKAQLDNDLPKALSGDDQILMSLFEEESLLHDGNSRSKGQSVIVDSHLFCLAALPFCDICIWSGDQALVDQVDPNVVLGGQFYPIDKLEAQGAILLADYLDSLADQDVAETAKYTKIGPFNLYSPHEGKNRVSLYRDLQRPIRALIRVEHYPAAKDLELIMLMPHNIPALVLKSPLTKPYPYSWIQFVRTSSGLVALLPIRESVGILEQYGVKWGESRSCSEALQAERRWLLYIAHNYYEK